MGTHTQTTKRTGLAKELAETAQSVRSRQEQERQQKVAAEKQAREERVAKRYRETVRGLKEQLRQAAADGDTALTLVRGYDNSFDEEQSMLIRRLEEWAKKNKLETFTEYREGMWSNCDGYMPGSASFGITW